MFSPTPWKYRPVSVCESTGEPFADIVSADGKPVADAVNKKDAEAIIKAANASSPAASRPDDSK
jgi:hypothetical protein